MSWFFDKLQAKQETEHSVASALIAVGDLCANWIDTEVGRYVVARAEEYELEILHEMARTKPDDTTRLIQLQERAKVPAMLIKFLDDAISDGEAARIQLNGEE